MKTFVFAVLLCLPLLGQNAQKQILLADTDAPLTPTDSPGGGTYGSTQSVTFSDPTATTIFYTNDGSTTPTCVGTGTLYTGAISTAVTTTYKVIGCNGITGSGVLSSTYTISGGGGPVSGWVTRFNAQTSADLYKVIGPPPTTNPSNGDIVKVWVDSGADFTWGEASAASDAIWNSTGLSSAGALVTDGSVQKYSLVNTAINTFKTLASLIANNAYTIWIKFSTDADSTNASDSAPYNNTQLITDEGGYFGIFTRSPSAGTSEICAYNFASSYGTCPCQTVTQSAAHVAMVRHDSGNLIVAVDNGTENSQTSGDTASLTGHLFLLTNYNSTVYSTGKIAEIIVYNTAQGSTDRGTNWTYFGY